ncbi:hypothetical protein GJ744_003846 [Endocarpon pusillum]|uniref:Amidoligase enzyme n=1 Tax=Endocarpon pusillum TaxID=364733 RepID=A0A8H7AMA3_9EURO|nr:hypothetical protein GJ744_003846 [Endocarpon pusillum]
MAAIACTPTAGTKTRPSSSQASANPPCTPRARAQSSTRQAVGPIGMPWPPPDLPVPSSRQHAVLSPRAEPLTESKKRIITIGIESEFELDPRYEDGKRATLAEFVAALAIEHNHLVPSRHPRMQTFIKRKDSSQYAKWCMAEEPSITVAGRPCPPWTIEMISPILVAYPGSKWREDVEATWKYLQDQYHITTNRRCSTHIHLSLDPFYTTPEIKRIAQACIYFEPAFEAIVPPVRRFNAYAKSNWLDSPTVAREDRSRSELIAAIEGAVQVDVIARLMQYRGDREYAWNFWALFRRRTIEFRKPPACTRPEEVLAWAELALSFIQACIKYENTTQLQKVPPTIGGLRWFLSQFTEAGVNEPKRMQRLWWGRSANAMVQPYPQPVGFWAWEVAARSAMIERLKRLREAEMKQSLVLARRGRAPFW